jgi:hypothetical protein
MSLQNFFKKSIIPVLAVSTFLNFSTISNVNASNSLTNRSPVPFKTITLNQDENLDGYLRKVCGGIVSDELYNYNLDLIKKKNNIESFRKVKAGKYEIPSICDNPLVNDQVETILQRGYVEAGKEWGNSYSRIADKLRTLGIRVGSKTLFESTFNFKNPKKKVDYSSMGKVSLGQKIYLPEVLKKELLRTLVDEFPVEIMPRQEPIKKQQEILDSDGTTSIKTILKENTGNNFISDLCTWKAVKVSKKTKIGDIKKKYNFNTNQKTILALGIKDDRSLIAGKTYKIQVCDTSLSQFKVSDIQYNRKLVAQLSASEISNL